MCLLLCKNLIIFFVTTPVGMAFFHQRKIIGIVHAKIAEITGFFLVLRMRVFKVCYILARFGTNAFIMKKTFRFFKIFPAFIIYISLISMGPLNGNPNKNFQEAGFLNSAELEVRVKNVPLGNPLVPGEQGLVTLKKQGLERTLSTQNGQVLFSNLLVGDGYHLEVSHESGSTVFENAREYWGSKENISIEQTLNKIEFIRNMPYVGGIRAFDGDNFALYSGVETGTTVRIHLLVRNPNPEKQAVQVLVKLKNIADGKTHLLKKQTEVNGRDNRRVILEFPATAEGIYRYAPALMLADGSGRFTDCWDWVAEPLFSVVEERRELSFAGYRWDVKAGFGHPGPNLWSNHPDHVWVDENGDLHLSLLRENGHWFASEVISKEKFGYGTYTFRLKSDPSAYCPNAVAAIFLFGDNENEIDIELTRWGNPDNPNIGNYVIQPSTVHGNHYRFPIEFEGSHTTHQIVWSPGKVLFQSWHGHESDPDPHLEIASWKYTGNQVPEEGDMRLHFNLWLFRGLLPDQPNPHHLVISDFEFIPN